MERQIDVWFTRHSDSLFYVVAWADNEPKQSPKKTVSVAATLNRLGRLDHKIAQVGILPPDMLGLD